MNHRVDIPRTSGKGQPLTIANLAPGQYLGVWSGYEIEILLDYNRTVHIDTDIEMRGSADVVVVIKLDGSVSWNLKSKLHGLMEGA